MSVRSKFNRERDGTSCRKDGRQEPVTDVHMLDMARGIQPPPLSTTMGPPGTGPSVTLPMQLCGAPIKGQALSNAMFGPPT